MEVAQQFGYTTAKEFANFLKRYRPTISTNETGRELLALI